MLRRVMTILGVTGLACLLTGHTSAGPHQYGVLIPHLNPQLEYSYSPYVTYEGFSDLRSCEKSITEGQIDPEKAQVWYVIASFEDSPGPINLGGVDFGFAGFDGSRIGFIDYAPCNDGFLELTTNGWPGPNEGVAVTWEFAQRSDLVEIYWFATYVYGPVSIELSVDPLFGSARFGTKTPPDPPIMDDVWDFGTLGFGEQGYNPCGGGALTGACCVGEECHLVTRDQCEAMNGYYRGDNAPCFPNPCREETIDTSWGRLKDIYR